MSKCQHKFKKRVYGPFSAANIHYKVVCSDCLSLLDTNTEVPAKAEFKAAEAITDANRLGLSELITRLESVELSDWEQSFVDCYSERLRKYDNVYVSEKQQSILDRMQGKHLPGVKPAPESVESRLSQVTAAATGEVKDNYKPTDSLDDIPF